MAKINGLSSDSRPTPQKDESASELSVAPPGTPKRQTPKTEAELKETLTTAFGDAQDKLQALNNRDLGDCRENTLKILLLGALENRLKDKGFHVYSEVRIIKGNGPGETSRYIDLLIVDGDLAEPGKISTAYVLEVKYSALPFIWHIGYRRDGRRYYNCKIYKRVNGQRQELHEGEFETIKKWKVMYDLDNAQYKRETPWGKKWEERRAANRDSGECKRMNRKTGLPRDLGYLTVKEINDIAWIQVDHYAELLGKRLIEVQEGSEPSKKIPKPLSLDKVHRVIVHGIGDMIFYEIDRSEGQN